MLLATVTISGWHLWSKVIPNDYSCYHIKAIHVQFITYVRIASYDNSCAMNTCAGNWVGLTKELVGVVVRDYFDRPTI